MGSFRSTRGACSVFCGLGAAVLPYGDAGVRAAVGVRFRDGALRGSWAVESRTSCGGSRDRLTVLLMHNDRVSEREGDAMKINKRALASVACGLCCALCVGVYLVSVKGEADEARAQALARYGGDQIEVCVAARDLATGEIVESGAVATKMWVADLLPEGAVTDPAQIVGQRLGSPVYRGEVVCARRMEAGGSDLSVPEGMAALSVPARPVQAVGGSVEPGMVVDVYATGPASTSRLVTGALVLASSATSDGMAGASQAAWVTLAVQPERVQEIVAAAQNLELYFALPPEGVAAGGENATAASAPEAGTPAEEIVSGAPVPESADGPSAAAVESEPAGVVS